MRFSLRVFALPLSVAALFFATATGQAHQRVYADSYGNLIVHSPSGHKQIIVGKGHLADDVRAEIGEPVILYGHSRDGGRYYEQSAGAGHDYFHQSHGASCSPHVVLKGRAFMYGINRGESANISKYCR